MRRLISIVGLVILSLLIPKLSYAEKKESPASIPGSTKVNAEQLIEAAEKYSDLVIIDSRIIDDRQQGYISGSHSLPDEETNCNSLSKLVPTLSSPALYYCNGPKCGRSGKAVKIALQCGYSKIFWFRGGFEEWKNKEYPLVKY
ncbi:hypothetical protein A9Q99_00620 [Gammaproteobacteria bacterium 45_16_T64]|nr:hypothetical protein A9Q99_00620 [Gammaproteobacteria bacterium 45_16_T64]